MKKILLYFILLFSLVAEAQYTFIVMPSAEVPVNNDVLQFKLNKWRPRSMVELAADLNFAINAFDTTYIYAAVNARVRYVDTSAMFSTYRTALNERVNYADTAALFAAYRAAINGRVNYSDTSDMLAAYHTGLLNRSLVGHTHTIAEVTSLQAAIDDKQATLSSGVNIKTINGLTILGSGDMVVSGEGGGAVYGSITGDLEDQADLQAALDGKQPLHAHLTSISGLTPVNDDIAQYKAGAWTHRTIAQYKTDLNYVIADLPGLQAAIDGKSPVDNPTFTTRITTPLIKITAGVPGAGKVLTSDADGDGSWENPSGQPLDAELTEIAALIPEEDDVLHYVGAEWTAISTTQLKVVMQLNQVSNMSPADLDANPGTIINKIIDGSQLVDASVGTAKLSETHNVGVLGLPLRSITEPAATDTAATLHSQMVAGRNILSEVSDDGISRVLGSHPAFTRVGILAYGGGTTSSSGFGLSAGTPTPSSGLVGTAPSGTVPFTQKRRVTCNSLTTAGSYAIHRSPNNIFNLNATAGLGGFDIYIDFGISNYIAGPAFAGLVPSATGGSATPGNPGGYINFIGIGADDTATNFSIMHNDGTAPITRVYLGSNFPANTSASDWYQLILHALPGQVNLVQWKVIRTNSTGTQFTAEGSMTTNLPASAQMFYWMVMKGNGATASSTGIDFAQIVSDVKW